jgi:phosphinothricin acetyltransferase
VDQNLTGKGLGTQLYQALLDRLESTTAHTIVGSIALPNLPSIALHEKLGFQKVAHFKEVGWKFGQWIDVGYWQRPIG